MIYEAYEPTNMHSPSTTLEITNHTNNDPLVLFPQPPPPFNPHSRTDPPCPDPAILMPVQVVWNSLCARLPTLRAVLPTTLRVPDTIPVPHQSPGNVDAYPPIPTPPPTMLQQAQTHWAAIFQQPRVNQIPDGNRPVLLSVANQRTNCPWGDAMDKKSATATRIYGLNVNGLTLDRRGGQFDVLCEVLKEVQADVMCGQEHNLDSDQTPVRSIIFHTIRNHWQRSKATFGTTPIPFNNMYKPGGTFMVTAGNLSGRLIQSDQDLWGRWVSHTYQGKGTNKITIMSAYQVVAKDITPGSTTTAAQQHSLLLQQQDTVSNPRTAFRRDLIVAIQSFQTLHHEILLLGDFNEVFGSDPDGMTKVAVSCSLLDLMTLRHSTTPPATYARGSKRLDYALGTTHVAAALIRSGYEAFNTRFHSDHRAYYLDFDTKRLFGTDTQTLGNHTARVLRSNNVKQTTHYLKLKYDLLLEHNAFERGNQLTHPGDRHQFAERLDRDVVAASLAAESKLKIYGTPAWSVKLAKARQKVLYLSKCESMARTGLDHMSQMQEPSQTEWNTEPLVIPTTLRECIDQLKEAKREVKTIVKASFAHRDNERRERIQDLEESASPKDKKSAMILRRLKKAEDIKELFKKLKPLRTKESRKGVTRIEIPVHPDVDPKSCTDWQQIEVPTEVLFHLQQRNRRHFGQAKGSPFTIPPLADQVGYCADGPSVEQILKGTYDTSGLDSNVALLLQHLKITEEMAALVAHPTITEQEYVGKLKVWKESTSTSPSGLHLGHYKALITRHEHSDPDTADEDQRNEWNHMQSCLLTLHVQMLNYALERGYSYTRWQTVVNTILFKDTDNVRIHRTRVIHIYEADYNLTLGIKWRMALYQAEALRELNQGQYGSRPRRNAMDPVFLEEIQFEISRASRKMLVQTNYDATSCYDRIVPNLAMMVSRKYGVPLMITQTNARTLEHAEYRIRTELGVSEAGYSHTEEYPIYGTGQGSGNSPMIWCFLSSVLFDCYDTLSYKATYCWPDCTHNMELGMIGFVDDSNGQTNCFKTDETPSTLLTMRLKLKHNAQSWADLLGASGGALELSKCSCHLLAWTFAAQGDPVLIHTKQPAEAPLTVVDPLTGEVQALQFLSPYSAHKTLGHYKDPAGTQNEQYRQLWNKSDNSTEFLWKCQLTPLETWTYYFACYLPSIGYPLGCSSLTFNQLDRIQRKAMSIIIPKCGYNRHTKRAIMYGPMQYGGANFRHLYMQQGVSQVTTFLRHWRQQLAPGKLLKIALAWHQLSLGISYPFLSRVHENLPHCESKWLASMRTFLAVINATIEVDEPGIPPKQRHGDEYLMDMILDSGQFTNAQIRRLNYCRLYLQAITLSDVTDADGQVLDLSKRQGKQSFQSSRTTWLHVNQDRPSTPEWTLWKKANLIWSYPDGTLHTPLGEWLVQPHQQRQRHFAYTRGNRRKSKRLYIQVGEAYIICKPTHQHQVYQMSNKQIPYNVLPRDLHPVEVEATKHPDRWLVRSRQRPPIPPVRSNPITPTFEDFVDTFQPWEIDLLRHTTMIVDPYTLCETLTQGLRGGSDGSVRHFTDGSFGWMLSTPQGERMATGMGPARGPRPPSYRAEAYGMLSILRFLIRVAEYTSTVEPWTGSIVTDSHSVLKTLGGGDVDPQEAEDDPVNIDGDEVVLDVLCPDWDVLIEIQQALKQLPGLTLKYIKAHQDDKIPYAQLPLNAQLNVDADNLADEFQDQHGCYRPTILMMPHTRVLIHLSTGSITAHFARTLRNAYCGPPLLQHMMEKNHWSDATTTSINWEAHGSCLSKQLNRNCHYTKLVHDLLPTHSWLNKLDKGKRTCPQCDESREDRDHILRCPAVSRNKWRHAFLTAVTNYCVMHFTFPPMQTLLMDVLCQWLYTDSAAEYEPNRTQYPQRLHALIAAQNRIGWRQLFKGRFSQG